MPWSGVLLLLALLSRQASAEIPAYEDITTEEAEDPPSPIQRPIELKRALTLLSRLAPIRNVFRTAEESDRHYDPRSYRPRWHTNIHERAPAGPLRWG